MDLQQYIHALRTYWWVVALPVVAGLALGVLMSVRADPQYRASLTFFVATPGGTAGVVEGDEFAQRRVNSYLGLLSSDRLAQRVVAASDLDLTTGQVRSMMGGDADVDTVLLTATVTSASRQVATEVADAVATEFVDLVDDVESAEGGVSSVSLELVSGPRVAELPPRWLLAVGVPTAAGLAVGLGLAWFAELHDKAIRSESQLRALGVGPTLGSIPLDRRLREVPTGRRRSIVSSPGLEAFRQLRTNLEFIDVDRPVRVLVVTSPVAQDGKTTTATELAVAVAAADRAVLVVEGDLRRPTVVDHLPVAGTAGLTDTLLGREPIEQVLYPTPVEGVSVLPAGQLPPNPSELLGSRAMVDLLMDLRERFDLVLVNTPPLLPVTDAAVLAAHADGVLVVVRAGRTTRQQLVTAVQSLQTVGARVLGMVLNMAPSHRGAAYSSHQDRRGQHAAPSGGNGQRGQGAAGAAQPARPS